ncbi:MAG: peptidoglycan-binding protein [Kiloniellaceae bacterium]
MFRSGCAAVALALVLSACGSTTEERGLSGAGLGAAAGAVLGAVTGLGIVEGVVIGAAAGGLTGALTDEDTIDLGDPFWKKDGAGSRAASGGSAGESEADMVKSIQRGLAELGYQPGPADGIPGPKTAAAIRRYQKDHGLPTDGRTSAELAQHIQGQTQNPGPRAAIIEPHAN